MRSAVVVAGGRSTRFGDVDKTVADLAGTPMIRRVVDRIGPAVDEVVVNCRADQQGAIEDALAGFERPTAVAVDPEPDRGPMAGIATGLRATAGEYALVVACDMPLVDPSFVAYLFERAAGHDAAVPRPDEWFQTTQAVYRVEPMLAACERALDDGDGRVLAAVDALDCVVVHEDAIETHASTETFRNVNTREEFEAIEQRFSGCLDGGSEP